MSNIYVSLGIRIRSNQTLEQIGERVGRVLGCNFVSTENPNYPDETILQAQVFCLKLMISEGHFPEEPTPIYQLNGENIIEPRWNYSDELDLSLWMLQEFKQKDSNDWYMPSLDELKKQAGIK